MRVEARKRPGAPVGEREIGSFGGERPGPLLVCLTALHGNEPAGVQAARAVLDELRRVGPLFRGRLLALIGNLRALERGRRFLEHDLNRIWTRERMDSLARREPAEDRPEEREQRELVAALEEAIAGADGPVILVDLHSSSAPGVPFTIVTDTLSNRRTGLMLPLPLILGLEERLEGTLEEMVCSLGHTAVAVEGGQHDDARTTENLEAALWVILVVAGCLGRDAVPGLDRRYAMLKDAARGSPGVVNVRHRHPVRPEDGFAMTPGYVNFQRVERGQRLADSAAGPVPAGEDGIVLLPLYQGLGEDGFFLGRELPRRWLRVSALVRRLRLGWLLRFLPGVRAHPERRDCLMVRPDRAHGTVRDLLHLFGYRRNRPEGDWRVFFTGERQWGRKGRARRTAERSS